MDYSLCNQMIQPANLNRRMDYYIYIYIFFFCKVAIINMLTAYTRKKRLHFDQKEETGYTICDEINHIFMYPNTLPQVTIRLRRHIIFFLGALMLLLKPGGM